jgi:hypothetical protein
MIVDWRIYATVYALCVAIYASSIFFVGTKWFDRLFNWSLIAAGSVGLVNYLDWIWS